MIARVISQGHKDGKLQVVVTVESGEPEPLYQGKEIAACLNELYRDLQGTIYATLSIFEYVPPEAEAVNVKAMVKK